MKHLAKECKNMSEVNRYLKSVGLEDFVLDENVISTYGEFDFDGWIDGSETKGASINVDKNYEVLIVKYTPKDLAELERELA